VCTKCGCCQHQLLCLREIEWWQWDLPEQQPCQDDCHTPGPAASTLSVGWLLQGRKGGGPTLLAAVGYASVP